MLISKLSDYAAKYEKLAQQMPLTSAALTSALKTGPVNYYAPGFQQEALAVFRNMLQKYKISAGEAHILIIAKPDGNVNMIPFDPSYGPESSPALKDTVNILSQKYGPAIKDQVIKNMGKPQQEVTTGWIKFY